MSYLITHSEYNLEKIPASFFKWLIEEKKLKVLIEDLYNELKKYFSHEVILDIEEDWFENELLDYAYSHDIETQKQDIKLVLNYLGFIKAANNNLFGLLSIPEFFEAGILITNGIEPHETLPLSIEPYMISRFLSCINDITYKDIDFNDMYKYEDIKAYLTAIYIEHEVYWVDPRINEIQERVYEFADLPAPEIKKLIDAKKLTIELIEELENEGIRKLILDKLNSPENTSEVSNKENIFRILEDILDNFEKQYDYLIRYNVIQYFYSYILSDKNIFEKIFFE